MRRSRRPDVRTLPGVGTAALGTAEIAFLLPFPLIVWGADELRRWFLRRPR